MELTPAQWWLIAAIVLFILEVLTPGFVLANLALGAMAAAGAAALGGGAITQAASFCVACLISFFTVRPFMQRVAFGNAARMRTGTEALIGATAVVRQRISMPLGGRVQVGGDDWSARSENDLDIAEGQAVEVIRVESTVLIVRPLAPTP